MKGGKKMETILDIKKALQNIPDELLNNLWFGCGEGSEELVSLVAGEGSGKYEFPQVWDLVDKKYPQLNELNKLIKNIVKAQEMIDGQKEDIIERISEEPITSDFFDKKNKK